MAYGEKSVHEHKTVYQTARKEAGLTRQQASEKIGFLSESSIEKIEYEKSKPHSEEVLTMAEAYRKPELCNYYFVNECPIGNRYVPEVTSTNLFTVVLQMIASLNSLEKEKDRLIEITVDGKVSQDELKDFARIQKLISQISQAAESMRFWVEQSIIDGNIDKEQSNSLM